MHYHSCGLTEAKSVDLADAGTPGLLVLLTGDEIPDPTGHVPLWSCLQKLLIFFYQLPPSPILAIPPVCVCVCVWYVCVCVCVCVIRKEDVA